MHIRPVHIPSALLGSICAAVVFVSLGMQLTYSAKGFAGLTPEQAEILSHMSIVSLPDGQGGQTETIRFTGVNVQIVNGLGATNGDTADPYSFNEPPTATNGVGNLIVGYNEPMNDGHDVRTGSHNIVGGAIGSNYTRWGGIVVGSHNQILGPGACAVGGAANQASGVWSVASGGYANVGSGYLSSVTGGSQSTASGEYSTITGGNVNSATGNNSWVGGGELNNATGILAGVCGGEQNTAAGYGSVIGGGRTRMVSGTDNWQAGSLFEPN
jgi:hypothetical protein